MLITPFSASHALIFYFLFITFFAFHFHYAMLFFLYAHIAATIADMSCAPSLFRCLFRFMSLLIA